MDNLMQEMQQCLEHNILPFWIDRMTDHERGGYYGRIDGHDQLHPEAEKGAVLNARILWAMAAAYRVLGKPEYLDAALRARNYIFEHFIDEEHGGVYWSVDCNGRPLDTKKQTYALGFTIYGMSELARATGDEQALQCAKSLYRTIEEHAFDTQHVGYIEALTRQWQPIADMRLSAKDENGSRTMNTPLHIIEPYTNLYRVWPDAGLRRSIIRLIGIFKERFLNPATHHLDLFFDDEWQGSRNMQSFGHDIEASWLLHETALVLADEQILAEVEPMVKHIAVAADEGLQPDGSMIYERNTTTGLTDAQRQWWVQCECIIGHVNLYQHFGDEQALTVAKRCWHYVQQHLIDLEMGEWHWAVLPDGSINLTDDKAGFWKCPYHNARMCLEIMERTAQ